MSDNDWPRSRRRAGEDAVRVDLCLALTKGVAVGAAIEFWWVVVQIQSDQPWADGLMQRSLFGRSGDTGPDGKW